MNDLYTRSSIILFVPLLPFLLITCILMRLDTCAVTPPPSSRISQIISSVRTPPLLSVACDTCFRTYGYLTYCLYFLEVPGRWAQMEYPVDLQKGGKPDSQF